MKIAVFSGEIPTTTFIEQLINGVAKEHTVMLFGAIIKPYKKLNKNIKIYKTPTSLKKNFLISIYRSILLLLSTPKDFFRLIDEIKRFPTKYDQWVWFTKFLPIILYRPDILHLQWARDVEFYAFMQRFGIKIIISLRGAHINYTPIVDPRANLEYKKNFPKIDAFHSVSEALVKEVCKYNADPKKIRVIHSPIPEYFFESFITDRPRNKKLQIISVGRIHWIKGYKYALDALSLLKQQNLSFHYHLVGAQKIPEAILFQLDQLDLLENITIHDHFPQKDLINKMSKMDVLLLSSLKEGIANVVLEAMAMGLPVVSSNCGGLNEVVLPNKTGWLVPVRDPEAIADAIVSVFQSMPEELNRIRYNAHNYVKKHFNAKDSIGQFIRMYQEVISQ